MEVEREKRAPFPIPSYFLKLHSPMGRGKPDDCQLPMSGEGHGGPWAEVGVV
jgi:hypothetical protein